MIMQGAPAIIPNSLFTIDGSVWPHLFFVPGRRRRHYLELRTRLHHVDDGAILHLLGPGGAALIEIKVRPVRHRQNFPGLRPHQKDGGLSGEYSRTAASISFSTIFCKFKS